MGTMQDHYDVVVVGSGYGGGIAAARLAEAGRRVCVLERGRELHPGQYPDSLVGALREMQASSPRGHLGRPTAMFDFHLNHDISVLVGCGLGGTSLINANVAMRPQPWIFEDPRWPPELQGEAGVRELAPYFQRAELMLGSNPYPDSWPTLRKFEALERSARALGAVAKPVKINVTFETGPNAAGVEQRACVLCGDCVSGCNYRAKNTVLMNYLPYARGRDAHIFTEVQARTVRPSGPNEKGNWVVDLDLLGSGRFRFGNRPTQSVRADEVILAAGTLGTTEILLRSMKLGLPLSERVGERFTGNGDVLGFAYDTDQRVAGIGLGPRPPSRDRTVGPTILGAIDMTREGGPSLARSRTSKEHRGFLIEDGAIPGAAAGGAGLAAAFWAASLVLGEASPTNWAKMVRRVLGEAAAIPFGSRRGPLARTMTYLLMSTDDDDGKLFLDGDRVAISWPDMGERPVFRLDSAGLKKAAQGLRGAYIPNPLWTTPLGHSLVTVHPLGGCVMGSDPEGAVVDHLGRVFTGTSGSDGPEVHEGLYVMDGSIVPIPLDANPSLTISALAERMCALMLRPKAGTSRPPPKPPPKPRPKPRPKARTSRTRT